MPLRNHNLKLDGTLYKSTTTNYGVHHDPWWDLWCVPWTWKWGGIGGCTPRDPTTSLYVHHDLSWVLWWNTFSKATLTWNQHCQVVSPWGPSWVMICTMSCGGFLGGTLHGFLELFYSKDCFQFLTLEALQTITLSLPPCTQGLGA